MIYLASTSPRRKALLKKAGVRFRILKPHYHEDSRLKAPPSQIVKIHARKKAESCVKRVKDGTVIAADTLVYLDGQIIGKPKNIKDAERILRKLQGRWHAVYTGVAIFKIQSGHAVKKDVFHVKTKVRLKKLGPQGIRHYFKKVRPLDKAGAYAIQSPHGGIVDKAGAYAIQSPHGGIVEDVQGSFTNAVGLPIEKVLSKL
ncbi:MAG TPA: Maf family protein [bacterium]|nr:Maf family protein [bacterium]